MLGSRVAIALALAAVASCGSKQETITPVLLTKIVPTGIAVDTKAAEAGSWSLFDRDVDTGYAPRDRASLRVTFGPGPRHLAALKVYGRAPYTLEVRTLDNAIALPWLRTIDLSAASTGWNQYDLATPLAVSGVTLEFHAHGDAAPIPELEFWGVEADSSKLPSLPDAPPLAQDPRIDVLDAATGDLAIAPGACGVAQWVMARSPAVYRRVWLGYRASGILRPFAIQRSLNGTPNIGGRWLESASTTEFVEAIDPEQLSLGENSLTFCLPSSATGIASISQVKILGELDTGVVYAASDINAAATLTMQLDRLVAPDVLALATSSASVSLAECLEGGTWIQLPFARTASSDTQWLRFQSAGRACSSLRVTLARPTTIGQLAMTGSGARDRIDWPSIQIAGPLEHFGSWASVNGWVSVPPGLTGPIHLTIGESELDGLSGLYDSRITRDGSSEAPWPVTIKASLSGGQTISRQVVLTQASQADLLQSTTRHVDQPMALRFGTAGPGTVTAMVRPTEGASVRLGTDVGADIPAGALSGNQTINITINHLAADAIPQLDPGLVNVTAPGGHAYEYLPRGQRFQKAVSVLVPYEPALIPEGSTASDIHTYIYDSVQKRWTALPRADVDPALHVAQSSTDHFAIMIDAVLSVPETPTPLSFDPTSLSSIAAGDPKANIDLFEPPTADATGDAKLSFPIRLPPGRGTFTPSLAISYSSASANGWVGVGWDLPISSIEIDTRFGVPTYAADEEERYLLDGEALVPTLETDGPTCRSGGPGRRYRPRVEGAFRHIQKCTDHWEVHDQRGVLYVYGDSPTSRLASGTGNVFRWHLATVIDPNDNRTLFIYETDTGGAPAQPWTQVYLKEIDYTDHPKAPFAYSVEFVRDVASRPDVIITARPGFKVETRGLLRSIRVKFQGEVVRQYDLTYQHGQFSKSLLSTITVYGLGGCGTSPSAFDLSCPARGHFYQQQFTYYTEPEAFAAPVVWNVAGDPDPSSSSLNRGHSDTTDFSLSFSILGIFNLSGHHSSGDRLEHVGLYDVNGDGLVDEVYSGGGQVFALYNQYTPTLDPVTGNLLARGPPDLLNLDSLAHDQISSWGVEASGGFFGIGAHAAFSDGTTRADRVLTDFDGDGFADVVTPSGVLHSQPCAQGMCFTPVPFGSTVDPTLDTLLQAIEGDVGGDSELLDPIEGWVAPFPGMVTVEATATKASAGGKDGVAVELYVDDFLLTSVTIAPGDTQTKVLAPQSFHMDPTHAIYLRVSTGQNDGVEAAALRDAVSTHLKVTYQEACLEPTNTCDSIADPSVARDPSGAFAFIYDSANDFRLAGTPVPVVAPALGTVELHAQLSHPAVPADLRVCFQKIDSSLSTVDIGCTTNFPGVTLVRGPISIPSGSVGSIALDSSFTVAPNDRLLLRVESDLTFDPGAISLTPTGANLHLLSYTAVCLSGSSCTSDPNELDGLHFQTAHFGPYVPVYETAGPQIPFVVPHDGTYQVELPGRPGAAYLLAIRSNLQGILYQEACLRTSCAPQATNPSVTLTQGESLTIELVVDGGETGIPWTIPLNDGSTDFSAPLHIRILHPPAAPPTPFVGGYRGWEAGLWNEVQPFAPTKLIADMALATLTQERKGQISQSVAPMLPYFSGAFFTPGPIWIAPGTPAFVGASQMNASHAGAAALAPDGTFTGLGDSLYTSYVRLAGTQAVSFGANLSIGNVGVGFNVSSSTTDTTADLVDMNGDGVLDVVAPGLVGLDGSMRQRTGFTYGLTSDISTPQTSAGGRPMSMETGTPPQGTLSSGLDLSIGRSQTTQDLIDMNGDGLPDQVRRHGNLIQVRLNLGNGTFGVWESYGQVTLPKTVDGFNSAEESLGADSTSSMLSHETTLTQSLKIGFSIGGWPTFGAGEFASLQTTSTRTTFELADINGDGLPDLIFKKDGQPILVQLNRGGDFDPGPPHTWGTPPWGSALPLSAVLDATFEAIGLTGPDVLAGTSRGQGEDDLDYGASISIPVGIFSIGGGASASHRDDTFELALIDIDGDGSPDHVLRRSHDGQPGIVAVKHNQITGKANLLRGIVQPLGGLIALDYARTANTIGLPHARYVLSKVTEGVLTNFGSNFPIPDVVTTYAYANGYFDRNEKEFLGFGSLAVHRADGAILTRTFENHDYALHGRPLAEVFVDGAARLFTDTTYEYGAFPITDTHGALVQPDPRCTPTHRLLVQVPTACTPEFKALTNTTTRNFEGGATAKIRVVQELAYDRFGNITRTLDEADDSTPLDDLYSEDIYQVDTSTWIVSPSIATAYAGSPQGALLRSRTGTYDDRGRLTAVTVWTGSAFSTTALAYDDFGNITQVTLPPNSTGQSQAFTYTYDFTVHSHILSATDAFGYTGTTGVDLRFAVPTLSVDISGNRSARAYDDYGRLVSVSGPYDQSTPAITVSYPTDLPLRAVTTNRSSPPPSYTGPIPSDITTVTVDDGLGRALEVSKTSVVAGVTGMTTQGPPAYDNLGRVVTRPHPFFRPQTATGFVTPQTTPATQYAYDPLGRTTRTTYPDGTVETTDYSIAIATNGHPMFLAAVHDGNGHPHEIFTDLMQRTVAFVEHPDNAAVTRYGYDPIGKLTSIVDANGNQSSLGYDLRGLLTQLHNPDTGLITQAYDLAGNLILRQEPNHRASGSEGVKYQYDLNRLAKVDYPTKTDVVYTYGPPGSTDNSADRIVTATDETGTETRTYDKLGQTVGTRRVIDLHDAHRPPVTVQTGMVFDSLGRMLSLTYPDGEQLKYSYDAGGMLASLAGKQVYAADLRYDVFGNRIHIRLGNGVQSDWAYDPLRARLQTKTSTLPDHRRVQDLQYTYDAVGNPTQIASSLPAPVAIADLPGRGTWAFEYDPDDRLVHASANQALAPGKDTSYDEHFLYDAIHNLRRKDRVHTISTAGQGTTTPPATNFALTYQYGAARPHAASVVGDSSLDYDPSGNVVSAHQITTGATRHFIWDDDNRLAEVDGRGLRLIGFYDAGGVRVLKRSQEGETIFANKYYEITNGNQAAKHVFVGSTHVAAVLERIDGTRSNVFYYHSDHLGSTSILTSQVGDVYEHLEYFPDGELWVDSGRKGSGDGYFFTGKVLDQETGLYDFGQRFYDPRSSFWISVDPVLESGFSSAIAAPKMLSAYGYADESPTRLTDPDGRQVHEEYWDDMSPEERRAFGKRMHEVDLSLTTILWEGLDQLTHFLCVDVNLGGCGDMIEQRDKDVENGVDWDVANAKGLLYLGVTLTPEGHEESPSTKMPELELPPKDPAATRVKLRKGVKEQIRMNAERSPSGDYIDPNTKESIPKEGPFDYGHKPGEEWWRTRDTARKEGWSRKEVIEHQNSADKYQIEDPSSNRGHKHEKPKLPE